MDYFLLQLQYNIKLTINNIVKKYNLSKKDLLYEYYPKNLNNNLKKSLKEYLKNKKTLNISHHINTKYFKDNCGNKYLIVDSNPIITYGCEYTAIKV